MRLTVKITCAILLGMVLIFSIYSYFSIQRERDQLKKNLSREARHIGESLRVIVTEVWQRQGETEALAFLQKANKGYTQTLVRWVWVEGEVPEDYQPRVPLDQLDDLLRESDFVSVHTLLSKETRHLVSERELGLMKPTAFLINAARGPIVDEAALVRALRKKQIAGAGLDVYEDEPAMADGLAELENAVLLP
ncbi:MAG: hypothetical protein C0622_05555, partial [Desulfuromonas sp.]